MKGLKSPYQDPSIYRARLYKKTDSLHFGGVDHSEDKVQLSECLNRHTVAQPTEFRRFKLTILCEGDNMVYYGPISKGCERCRQRKIKCGRERPGCAQCARSMVACAGYRNLTDVVFRDETARVVARSQPRRRAAIHSSNKGWFRLPLSVTLEARGETALVLSKSVQEDRKHSKSSKPYVIRPDPLFCALVPSVHDRAAGFFFANFVYSDAPATTEFGDYLKKVYLDGTSEDALSLAMKALGLFGIARTSNDEMHMREAKRSYGRALALTNTALSDPQSALADTTLAAVWFLSICENMTSHSLADYRSWFLHIDGAMALIDLRGKEQFESEVGRLLFFKFRAQVMSSLLQRNLPVPQKIADWLVKANGPTIEECSKCLGSSTDLAISVSSITPIVTGIELCNLRAAIAGKTMTDPSKILEAAQGIEKDMAEMQQRASAASMIWTVVTEDRSDDCFQGVYEIHLDRAMAQSLSYLRTTAIIAHEIIVGHCEILRQQDSDGLTAEHEVLAWHSTAAIQQLSSEICNSTPYILGTLPKSLEDAQQRKPEVADAIALLWPLFVCATSKYVSDAMKRWARGRLLYINHIFGVSQAGLMVDAVDTGEETRPRGISSSTFQLGGYKF